MVIIMIDMHVHTRYSDGEHTPSEVINFAVEAGLSTIAITDHDTLDGLEEAVNAAKSAGISLIPGIEFSVDANSSHILGYNVDFRAMQHDSEFQRVATRVRDAKRSRARQMCENSQNDPINMHDKQGNQYSVSFSLEDIDTIVRARSIYTGHFATMMCKAIIQHLGVRIDLHDATELFFKNRKYEKFAAASIKDLDPNYDSEKVDGEKRLLDYVLIEKGKKYWYACDNTSAFPSASEAVYLIHKFNGVAVIAHPDEGTTRERVEHYIALGADGIEVYSPKNNGGKPYYEQLVSRYNLIATQGTDWHGKTYSPNKRLGVTGAGAAHTWMN